MSEEEIFKQFIYTLEDDIKNKTFLTYEEENEWKDYLQRIINSQTKKYKIVLDKIKKYVKEWRESDGSGSYGTLELLELLEEIE